MSDIISAAVQRRKVGSPTRKAVLMFLAAAASDDGGGIWISKSNIAADLEMGRRTVQNCVQKMLVLGLILEVGKHRCTNGFTVKYKIDLEAINALEFTRQGGEG